MSTTGMNIGAMASRGLNAVLNGASTLSQSTESITTQAPFVNSLKGLQFKNTCVSGDGWKKCHMITGFSQSTLSVDRTFYKNLPTRASDGVNWQKGFEEFTARRDTSKFNKSFQNLAQGDVRPANGVLGMLKF